MLKRIKTVFADFRAQEEGLALTEYLILLGLLTGGVILAVLAIGEDLNTAWEGWEEWFEDNVEKLDGPDAPAGGGT